MLVTFKNVQVVRVQSGVSKKGVPYANLRFFDTENGDMFECVAFGEKADSLSSIEPKTMINAISFDLQPTFSNGRYGLRLVPAW